MPLAVLASLFAALVTLVTLLAALRYRALIASSTGIVAAFAAGVLLTATITHLLPIAYEQSPNAPVWVLVGFSFAFLFNRGALAFGHDHGARERATAYAAAGAISFHSLVDGMAYAVTFAVSDFTGAVTALGLVMHEAPEAVIVFTLLLGAGHKARTAAFVSFLAAGLTTPLGAVLASSGLAGLEPASIGVALATAAGVLLFVAAGHLLPHVQKEPSRRALPALALGGAIVLGALGFGHDGHAHALADTLAWTWRS